MNLKSKILFFLTFVAAALVLLFCYSLAYQPDFSFADSTALLASLQNGIPQEWWLIDRFSGSMLYFTARPYLLLPVEYLGYGPTLLLLCSINILLCCAYFEMKPKADAVEHSGTLSVLLVCTPLLIFGLSLPLILCTTLLILLLICLQLPSPIIRGICTALAIFVTVNSAGALAPVLLLAVLLYDIESASTGSRTTRILLLFGALFTFAEALWQPAPWTPTYPSGAQLTEYGCYLREADPHIGWSLPLSVRNCELVTAPYAVYVILALLSLIVMSKVKVRLPFSGAVLALAGLSLLFEIGFLPEKIAPLNPYFALSGIFPGTNMSVLEMLSASTIVALAIYFLRNTFTLQFALIALLVLLVGIHHPYLLSKYSLPWNSSLAERLENSEYARKAFFSPSHSLLTTRTAAEHHLAQKLSGREFVPVMDYADSVRVSVNQDVLEKVLSQRAHASADKALRWHVPGGEHEREKESLHFTFKAPVEIDGLKVSSDPFHSDYPRGIEVLGQESCQLPSEHFLIKSVPETSENLEVTADGYPYLTHPARLTIRFEKRTQVCGLTLRITRRHQIYDWSITGIFLLQPELASSSESL